MSENPTEGGRFTRAGERIPPDDLLVGELSFGIDANIILAAAKKRQQDADILKEDGLDAILKNIRELYDRMVELEKSGLRGDDLCLAVKRDLKLLQFSKRYYGFLRGPIWGARQQSVWFVKDPETGEI